ncbi:MAG: hypothetical protein FJW23_15865, partial [Acidimicrobiia bacterium]|nr:hypothetical protein [Acidimicrobiia bacterium]
AYPDACVAGCTTAGEISNDGVADETAVVTALQLEHTRCVPATVDLKDCDSSRAAGRRLAASLPDHQTLRHVLVFSDGLKVNGSDLVQGLTTSLPAEVIVTGGLSGDGSRFKSTAVVAGGTLREGAIVAIGFYGDRLRVGTGSLGGWDSFGLERLVTRADGNVLYELDGQSALSLYKKYLGEQARDLPASGLLFPLSVRAAGQTAGVVRTVLSVDEQADSMTFAGDIPVGSHARLMKANFDRLIDGAIRAARASAMSLAGGKADCALLISCVGRKMVLQQRVEEEIDGVRDVVGAGAVLTGFYSYGEISPFTPTARCELHNQTMTITTFAEL